MAQAHLAALGITCFLLGVVLAHNGTSPLWPAVLLGVSLWGWSRFSRVHRGLFLLPFWILGGAFYYHAFFGLGADGTRLFIAKLESVKHAALAPFLKYLSPDAAAFMAGLTFGDKSGFSSELTRDFRLSGTSHLIALSGYNVSIITVTLFGWFARALPRRLAALTTVGLLTTFVLMVGAAASILRAAVMGLLMLLAKEIGRTYSLDLAALWAAFFMTLLNPASLFTPGFQLSFGSLLGIFYLDPALRFYLRLEQEKALNEFADSALLTVSAQLGVLPIILHNFGSFPLAGFLVNALILPLIPLTMLCGFILSLAGVLIPFLAQIFSYLTEALLAYELGLIHFFARLNFSLEIRTGAIFVLGYYVFLLIFILHMRHVETRQT